MKFNYFYQEKSKVDSTIYTKSHVLQPSKDTLKYICRIKKSGFYIIRFSNNGIKIGIAKDIGTRISGYCKPWCLPIIEVYLVTSNTYGQYEKSRLIEIYIKRNNKFDEFDGSVEYTKSICFNNIKLEVDRLHSQPFDVIYNKLNRKC